MSDKDKFDFTKHKINQLGYVYKDVERQAKILEEKFNLPKFAILENKNHHIKNRYGDETISVKIAFSRVFDKQIELIQWIDGECIYKEFIDQGNEGLHHFGIFINDLDSYIEYFTNRGYDVIHSGAIGKQTFAYFDTFDDFGIYWEFQETKRRKRKD